MERADEERPLLRLQPPQVVASEYTSDGSVDINKQPALKHSTGKWRACFFILGVEFCECMGFFAISQNLVTYLTTVLHESKIAAARNVSAWTGACFFMPLFGAFIADTYWGRYKTIVVFFPFYILAMAVLIASASLPTSTSIASTPSYDGHHSSSAGGVHRAVVYFGIYLAAIGSGGVKPCTSSFGADQFDTNDPDEVMKKGSFFNWYYFMISTSALLSGTVVVWLQDNGCCAVSYVIPALLMLTCFPLFLAGSKVYRFRRMGVSPLTSIFQVVVAAIRKWRMELPDDSSLLFELPSSATHRIKHTNEFRFFDKASIVSVVSANQVSPWRLCAVTQVEELKMLLRMLPVWASFLAFYAVGSLTGPMLVEQGMFMNNHVGSFAVPPASMSVVGVLSLLAWVPIYEAALVPLARRLTGNHRGFSPTQRLAIGQALSTLAMAYAALLEARRLAPARAEGLTDQSVPVVPMSILWQAPVYFLNGAAQVFACIGVTEYFYDQSPETMRSLGAALANLAIAAGSYLGSAVLGVVAVATTRGGAPGWIPDNLNQGHLDYFFLMWAFLSLLSLALFLLYSIRHLAKTAR